ncbi:MAG: DUF6340 family protein [Bacteroidales bacterium]
MRTLPFILLLVTGICFSGCSSLTYFDLPVYQVEETPFPATSGSIVLVNNAVEQPRKAASYIIYADKKEQILWFERDSANFPFLNMLGDQMLKSEFIKDVTLYNLPLRQDSLYSRTRALTAGQLNEIEKESGAEWILSLDALPHVTVLRENRIADFNLVSAFLKIQVSPVFHLYRAGQSEPVGRYSFTDTLSWNATQLELNNAIGMLPPLKDCFQEALYVTAEKVLHRWVPYASVENRFWVNHPHSVMREARNFYIKGDMEAAAYMWEYGYESVNHSQVKLYAAYNRAVLAEMQGDLSLALEWIDKCIALQPQNNQIYSFSLSDYRKSVVRQQESQKILNPIFN